MRRGTTPTITVTIDADLTGMEVHLALKSGELIVKDTDDLTITYEEGQTTIVANLTQEDTLAMKAGTNCQIQVRAYTPSGAVAMATTIGSVPVNQILEDGVLGGE